MAGDEHSKDRRPYGDEMTQAIANLESVTTQTETCFFPLIVAKQTDHRDKVYHQFFVESKGEGTDDIEKRRFESCASRWKRETSHFSSTSRKRRNNAYREMLAPGERIIPFVLKRMKNREYVFYLVLSDLVSSPPRITPNGDMEEIRRAWLKWGKMRGHVT